MCDDCRVLIAARPRNHQGPAAFPRGESGGFVLGEGQDCCQSVDQEDVGFSGQVFPM